MKSVKVLIVDDSVVYRSQIRAALSKYSWVEIVGTASNGKLALDRLKQTAVDLLILDLEMPEMDGLQTLTEISKLGYSVKVLVFSSLSRRGAEITLEALRIGAKDFVTKPGSETFSDQASTNPTDKIQSILEPKLSAFFPEHFSSAALQTSPTSTKVYPEIIWDLFKPSVVVIGSSTGGPTALELIWQNIRAKLSIPVLIAQHMPPIFTASLAERIKKLSGIDTKEGQHGEEIKNDTIYIAPGDYHMTLEGSPQSARIKLDKAPLINSVRPAVDPLFSSASKIYKAKTLGIVLTGMGHDGKSGAQDIKSNAGAIIIQNKESSIVYGMPGAVHESGAYDKIASLEEITNFIRDKATDQSFHPIQRELKNA